MKKFYILVLAILSLSVTTFGQLSGGTTYPINGVSNAPTSFSTIQDAATYLKNNGVTGSGNVILELQTGYNPFSEPATGIVIDSIPFASDANRVVFRPAIGYSAVCSLTVAGNGTLNFVHAKYVTIDGRPGGTGLTAALTFVNGSGASTDSTTCVKFGSDSRFNIIQYCVLQSFSKAAGYGGVIQFSKGINFGNSGNKIYRCDIDGKASVLQGIHSRGTTTTYTQENSADTIRGCNIFDYFNVSTVYGIYLQEGNTNWYIDSNSIYQTVARNFNTATNCIYYGIYAQVNYTGDQHIIFRNTIGGNAPNGSGATTLQTTNTNVLGLNGIYVNGIGGPNTIIQANTIRNISLSYAGSAGTFTNTGIQQFAGFNGATGYFFDNIIDNISLTNTAQSMVFFPVMCVGRIGTTASNVYPSFYIYRNKISNITTTSSTTSTHSSQIFGIRVDGNSNTSVLSGQCIPYAEVVGNKISNITATSGSTASTGTLARGFSTNYSQGAGSSAQLAMSLYLQEDTVLNLSTNSASTSVSSPGAIGILANAGGTIALIDTMVLFKNVVSGVSNTNNTDLSNAVAGIIGNNIAYFIDSNKVSDIRNAASGATGRPNIFGINVRNVVRGSDISHNQIALGNAQNNNTQVFGIVNNLNSADSVKIYNNSVVIAGTPASGSFNSSAIYRGSDTLAPVNVIKTPMLINSNLIINKRSGGSGLHTSIACQSIGAPAGFVSNYNALISAAATSAATWGGSTYNFAGWKTNSNNDTASYYAQSAGITDFTVNPATVNTNNLFNDASYETNANLAVNINNVEAWLLNGKGLAIPGSGTGRSTTVGTPTDIGYNEFSPSATNPTPTGYVSAAPAPSTTTTYSFAGRKLGEIVWGASVPTSVTWKYYSGIQGPSTTGAVINAYHDVPAVGSGPFNYDMKLYYTLAEQNQIADASLTGLKKDGASPWLAIGGTPSIDADGKFVTSTGLTTFSLFTLKDIINPIPVKLVSFTGKLNAAGTVDLQWQVTEQLGIKKYEVERSVDGRSYTAIGAVLANNLNSFTYTLNDALPIAGKNFYRLRIIENDGRFNFSQVVLITVRGRESFVIYPVPAVDKITIQTNKKDLMNTTAQLVDVQGKLVSKILLTSQVQQVNVKTIAAGIYFLKTADGNSYRIVKQ